MSEGWKVAGEGTPDTGGWTTAGAEVPIDVRTTGERFTENLTDAAARNPTVAATRQDFSAPGAAISPFVSVGKPASILPPIMRMGTGLGSMVTRAMGIKAPEILDAEKEKARRTTYEERSAADPFYRAPGGVVGKTIAGGATLGGQFAGAALDPLNYAQAGKTAVQRVLTQGGFNALGDVATQGADIASGVQGKWSPVQTAGAAVLGTALAGAGEAIRAPRFDAGGKMVEDAGPLRKWTLAKVEDVKDAAALRQVRKDAARQEAEIAEAVTQPWTVERLWAAQEHQESGGRQEATSPKGARGVAQLMPDTAVWWARQLGRPDYAELAMENSPRGKSVNRFLGQTYMARQLQDFGNDPVLALAAYNAGPGRARAWLERFGHPDQVGRAKWIEMIPFDETKKYVKTILGNSAGGRVELAPEDIQVRDDWVKENRAAEKAAAKAKAAEAARQPEVEPLPPVGRAADEAQQQMADRSAEIDQELRQPARQDGSEDAPWQSPAGDYGRPSKPGDWYIDTNGNKARHFESAVPGDASKVPQQIIMAGRERGELTISQLSQAERDMLEAAGFKPDSDGNYALDPFAEGQRRLAAGEWDNSMSPYDNSHLPPARAEEPSDFPGDWNAPEPTEPPVRDLTDDALDIIRSGKAIQMGQGESLINALVRLGGVRDEAGEISAMFDGNQRQLMKRLTRVNTGKTIDDATLWAWQNGYIGKPHERPDVQVLKDALKQEARGQKLYAWGGHEDAHLLEMQQRVDALEEMLNYLGLNAREMDNPTIRKAMDDFMAGASREEGDADWHPDADEDWRPRQEVLDEDVFGVKGQKAANQGDMFDADASQKAGQLAADLERAFRERQAKRGREPMDEGGLFDEARRGEQELFGLGGGKGGGAPDPAARARAAGKRLRDMDASTKGGLRAQPKARANPAPAGEKLPSVKGIRIIAKELLKKLDLVRRQGRIGMRGALGTYNRKTGMIRTVGSSELDVVAHEIGHAIEFTKKFPALEAVMKKHKDFLKSLDYQPKLARRHEGFAEWFRWFVTNPSYAHSLDPKFYQDFEAAMLTDSPNDLKSLMQAQEDYQAFLNAPSVAAARAQVMAPEGRGLFNTIYRAFKESGPGQAVQDFADEVYRGTVEMLNPWSKAVERLDEIYFRNTGKHLELTVMQNPYKLLRQMPAVASAGHMDIMDGVHGYHELTPDTPSLADALKIALGDKFFRWAAGKDGDPAGAQTIHNFGTYLTARRMIALYDNFAAGKLEQPPDSLSRNFWAQTRADIELARPEFAEAAGIIYDWTDALLMKRLNAGLIDAKTFHQVRADHDQYVPLFRDQSDKDLAPGSRGADTGRQGGLIRLKGSDRAVINPIHSMMQQAYELNAAIARNDALKALDDLGRIVGPDGAQIVERLPRKEMKGTKVDAMDALDKAAGEIGVSPADRQFVRDTLEQLFGDEAVTTVYRAVDMTPRAGENVVYVWRDGVKIPLQLADGKWGRQMIETLSGATPPMRGLILDIMSIPARVLRAGITTHPTFFVANWSRDQFQAALLTDVGYIFGLSNLKGIGAEAKQGDLIKRYNLAGGEVGGMKVAEEQRARGLRDVNALRTKGARLRHFASFKGFARATEVSETGTRLGIFEQAEKRAKRDGLSDYDAAREAAFEARDYMDFDRHGAWDTTRALMRVIPFFNAAIQGIDKEARVSIAGMRMLLEGRGPATVQEERDLKHAIVFWAAAATIASGSLALRAAYESDPEYQQLADYLRATHWVVPIPGSDEYAVIPKPYGLMASVSNAMERAFESTTMKDPTAWARFGEGLTQIWLPPIDAPVAMLPLELAQNRDSFGAPIVPDHLVHSREARDQKTDSTSSLATGFADLLRTVSGGKIDLSPAQVEYSAKATGGTWARDALRMGDDRAPITQNPSDMPFVSRFVKNWSRGAVSTKEFYKLVATQDGKFTKAANSFADLVRNGEHDEAASRLAKMKPEERAYVLTATFAQGVDKQSHPLIRATEAARELGGLAKDLREGDVMTVDPATGNLTPLRLTPDQRRAAVDGLKKMAVAEQNNALITAGVEGWARGRLPLPTEKYAREVDAAAPGVMPVLSMRFQQGKVLPPEAMHAQWAAVRAQLERQQDPAMLKAMMAHKMTTGSGAKERMLKTVVDAPKPQ